MCILLALLALVLLASVEYLAWDHRQMTAPRAVYTPAEEWATDLEWELASLPEVNVEPSRPIAQVLRSIDTRRAIVRGTYDWAAPLVTRSTRFDLAAV